MNILNKLTTTIETKINESKPHKKMWERQTIQSITEVMITLKLMKITLADVLHKSEFHKNFVMYIIVAAEDNIRRQILGRSAFDSYIIDIEKTQGELSVLEKMDINFACGDENQIIIREIQTNYIDKLFENSLIYIERDEFEYLRKNLKPNKDQIYLATLYLTTIFKSFNNSLNQEQYIKTALIMRNDLLRKGYIMLPSILIANPKTMMKRRVSTKTVSKIYDSPLYQLLSEQYSDILGDDIENGDKKDNPLIKPFLDLNSWVFESMLQDTRGELINSDMIPALLSHELLRFLTIL